MDILVYGAGVIGSVYAARLQEAGHNVSLLARGQRATSLRTHGIQLENALNGRRTTTQVSVVEQLAPTDMYDVVLVAVRLDQIHSILPILAANRTIPMLVFMLNNPLGMRQFEQLDPQRVIPGFPAVGGVREGEVVRYVTLRPAATMLGEADGHVTPRIRQLAALFKQAGFPVKPELRYANVAENPCTCRYVHHCIRLNGGEKERGACAVAPEGDAAGSGRS